MIEIQSTPLEGVKLIKPRVFKDERGVFSQSYHRSIYQEAGITDDFVQDNEAVSSKGVLRGMHYQVAPNGQSKLVRVTVGSVYDVVVDIRPDSPTYGEWYGVLLSAENGVQMYVPPQFAHGYLALEENSRFNYKCGGYYSPSEEGGILYNDPSIGIEWPELDCELIVSERDLSLPLFGEHRKR